MDLRNCTRRAAVALGVSALVGGTLALMPATAAQAAGTVDPTATQGYYYCSTLSIGFNTQTKRADLYNHYDCYYARVRGYFYYGNGVYGYVIGAPAQDIAYVQNSAANQLVKAQASGRPYSGTGYTAFTDAAAWGSGTVGRAFFHKIYF